MKIAGPLGEKDLQKGGFLKEGSSKRGLFGR